MSDKDGAFARQMYAHGSDPLLWREKALEHKIVADALLSHRTSAIQQRRANPHGQRRMFAFFHGYLLFMGLAIENALKGLRGADDPSLVTGNGMKRILGRGGHGIREGLGQYLSLNSEELNAATRLEEFLVWGAKYLVPMTVSDLERAETGRLRMHFSEDPDTLNVLFERLLALYPSSASPYE